MADIKMTALQPYKGRAVGEVFETSAKNARVLEAGGIAAPVKKAAKKTAAKKAPAKKAAKKAPAKQAYKTRALKAK